MSELRLASSLKCYWATSVVAVGRGEARMSKTGMNLNVKIRAAIALSTVHGNVPLTAHAHGGLQTNTGPTPFGMQGYHVYGAAVTEVEVDVLTGEGRLLASDILFDVGRSVNPAVDLGQVEGAFVFGLGYLLSEAMEHHPTTGAATTTSTWSYKTPGVMDIPTRLNVAMLKDSPMHVKDGPVSSKACGEPPLLLAASALFALQAATRAAASQTFGTAPQPFASLAVPATVAAVKAACGTRPLADLLRPTH
ncbi:hypothetical protein QJQ45_004015 [Haematococcus lacustris]|nr:hypothetical protein QJQ45_004015 [Haematococcus lacustris]